MYTASSDDKTCALLAVNKVRITHTHARTHARTHVRTHARTHAHTHTNKQTNTNMRA